MWEGRTTGSLEAPRFVDEADRRCIFDRSASLDSNNAVLLVCSLIALHEMLRSKTWHTRQQLASLCLPHDDDLTRLCAAAGSDQREQPGERGPLRESWPPPGAPCAVADPGEARKNILFVHPRPFVAFNVCYRHDHPVL